MDCASRDGCSSQNSASGVHPVPLGFGRVYVYCPEGFSYEKWLKGLMEGRTFVTTGPMLLVEVRGVLPEVRVSGGALSGQPLKNIEVVVNGEVVKRIKPANRRTENSLAYESTFDERLKIDGSSWVAVRCYEDHKDRVRFAHSNPVYIDVSGKPLRPRKAEVEYLIARVAEQIKRSKDLLPAEAMKEYEEALNAYKVIARDAR
jgi:hypothetical protein